MNTPCFSNNVHSDRQVQAAFEMPPSDNPDPLKQLLPLNKFSSKFHDQICNTLDGQAYRRWMRDASGRDIVQLVDFLDGVRCCTSILPPHSNHRRLLTISALPVVVLENACKNSDTYVVNE